MKYLFSKKAIPNYLVWTVTMLPAYFIKFSDLGTSRGVVYYLIFEWIVWFILGVLLTAGIQIGLEKQANSKSLKAKVVYLVVLMLIASVLFNYTFWPILDVFYEYFVQKKNYHGKFATRIFNWFNWILWFICITAFDLYDEVREQKVENIKLQATLKESQLNILKGQINPHFMFNSLNNIRGLMLEDVTKAREILTALSETLRYSLTQSDKNDIALEDELEIVEKYIAISKIQFEERLEYEQRVDEKSLEIKIPPMLIQMLIENAVKHGISNLKKGGKVSLIIQVIEKKLLIRVINSGQLKQHKESTQIGVRNIKNRLELLYKKRATFSLKEVENEVVATIEIPLL